MYTSTGHWHSKRVPILLWWESQMESKHECSTLLAGVCLYCQALSSDQQVTAPINTPVELAAASQVVWGNTPWTWRDNLHQSWPRLRHKISGMGSLDNLAYPQMPGRDRRTPKSLMLSAHAPDTPAARSCFLTGQHTASRREIKPTAKPELWNSWKWDALLSLCHYIVLDKICKDLNLLTLSFDTNYGQAG